MTRSPKSLADYLAAKLILTPERIAETRAAAERAGTSFERALLDQGILSTEDLLAIYGDVFQIKSIKLEDIEIDREAVRHVPAATAHRHHLIPVRRSGNSLMVAMSDPTNPEALGALKAVTDFDILPFVAAAEAVEHAIYLHYGEPDRDGTALTMDPDGASLFRLQHLISDDRFGHMAKGLLINRSQTLAVFEEDAGNQRALHIVKAALSGAVGEIDSPVLIYGAAGTGKTHLVHAAANQFLQQAPLKRLVAATGLQYADSLFECIRDGKLGFFRYIYRAADLLVLDAADYLCDRPWAQRELAATIADLRRENRQAIIAAQRNLIEEPAVIAELRALLRNGISAGLDAFTADGRRRVLHRWAKGMSVQPGQVDELAANSSGNLHDLRARLQHALLNDAVQRAPEADSPPLPLKTM